MQRGEGPKRRTEMKRTGFVRKQPSPKLSGSSLSKAARKPAPRKPLRSRPKPATPDEVEAKRIVVRRAEFERCEGCGRAAGLDPSHRIGQGVGGPWAAGNLVALCRRCHEWLGDNVTAARRNCGWRLESHQNYLIEPAWFYGMGWVLLDDAGGVTPINDIPDEENIA